MAQASTITTVARQRTTTLLDGLSQVGPILELIEDVGADDAARKIFFEDYLLDDQGLPTTDIGWTEFALAVAALRNLRTWLATNRPALSKLRI